MWRTNEMKACPIDSTFKIIGKRFTALIIRDMISLNETRFNQFMKSIEGLNSKTISEIERDGRQRINKEKDLSA
jgi:DNA-binding HxlR family transcriptional regulator